VTRRSPPVRELLELLGRRWALRLVWELRRDALSFSELRERLGISPSVLSQRLRDLAQAGVVERSKDRRYILSANGRELARVLYDLNRWAEAAAQGREDAARPSRGAILDS
jgi:DNA-binding HxlR family transcriptional regulator